MKQGITTKVQPLTPTHPFLRSREAGKLGSLSLAQRFRQSWIRAKAAKIRLLARPNLMKIITRGAPTPYSIDFGGGEEF